jgi:2-oxo-4-hydroxy-4-carboxy-5-ureidoimidazoline decarboxylase
MTTAMPDARATAAFNALAEEDARARLARCLDVPRWVDEILAGRPYADGAALVARAEETARELSDAELAAALAAHPRIGERAGSSAHDPELSSREQSGVNAADHRLAERLADGNRAYEARFDRVFLIRAAGRSGEEILAELERRLGNTDADERAETVTQLREIALLRLGQVV